ncbi:MAG: c-type cytochrome [Gallionellaceae bacterium]|nr:c-type cytochrome [Gallionellaceae bacterium]
MKAIVIAAAAALALTAGIASADQALAQKSACMSCHQLDKKVVGPALKDVAKKYKGDAKAEEHLVGVIKKGGKGVWGPVPMPPHPQVSDENAKKLAEWVLSL